MLESGKGRVPWLLIMELGQVTLNTPGVQSVGGEQERLFVATISGSRLQSNRCAGVSRVGWKTARNSGPGWHVVSITELGFGDCACHPVSYPPAQSPTSHLGAS